jgi:predicted GNAT family acetyltransferase
MSFTSQRPHDDPAHRRFVLPVDGEVAFAEYRLDGDVITFVHTFVPENLRGHGLATRLIEAGLASARDRGLKVDPQCPTFADYIDAHPETRDLVVED